MTLRAPDQSGQTSARVARRKASERPRAEGGATLGRRPMRSFVAAGIAAFLVALLLPSVPAAAATFTLSATRANSGTAAADAASTCAAQGTPTPDAHCAGYDTSLLAIDQILRTGDRANVRFDFAFDAGDSGVVLRSTLPLINGLAVATWPAPLPAACAAGSSLTDGGRTMNCRIANPLGPGDGSITATLLLSGAAPDGYTFTVHGEIASSSSAPVSSTGGATFTSSNAPFYDLRKDLTPNTLPQPFPYNSPEGIAGFAVPTATGAAVAKAGGWSQLAAPVTWIETVTSSSVDVSGYRLLNWGNYGGGCATQSGASTPANPGYTNFAVPISNQLGPAVNGQYTCSQPGGPGTPINVTWLNPAVLAAGIHAHMWVMLWVPAEDVPAGTSTVTVTASGFDPVDINGVSNYFADTERNTANNVRVSGQLVNQDNRTFDKYATSDSNPVASSQPSAIGAVQRGARFQSVLRFRNTGTVSQTPVQICDVFDSTVQTLTAFGSNPSFPANSHAVVVTAGPANDPILAPAYEPGASYNNTNNFAVDPSAYTVEYAAGDFDTGPPTNAPQSGASMGASGTAPGCADGGTATGWHSDPNDPAIAAYASSLGLSDPFDVINRVRVTLTGGPVLPGSYVGVKVRYTARSTYRDATTQAGDLILATTRIGDVGAFNYPQSTVAAWTSSPLAGPVIAGRIGVDTSVSKSANPTTVQAGAPGDNRTTYTVTASIAFGEDVSNTQPLRIVDHLPTGMRYVAGSASRAPDHVLVQPDRSTLIVWDMGNITGTTNQVTTLPAITFQGEADPLAPTPSVNHNRVITESVAPDGTALDTDPPTAGCATPVPFDVPPTPTVPVATVVAVPPPGNYSGCAGQGQFRRFGWVPVTIGNAFLQLGAAKTSLTNQIEPGSADGVAGAEVGWDLTITNTTSNALDGIDIVDVLPFDGDARNPASIFSGTLTLTDLDTGDTLSVTPNLLPSSGGGPFPPRSGTTFYVTSAAPAVIEDDPYAASNLAGGATQWCLLADFGDPGCPATLADATALRVISGSLASQASRSVRIGVATSGNADGDLYTNTAFARAIGLTSLVPVAGDSISVVASEIAGTVWNDGNGDGVFGGGETGIPGIDVRITGTGSDGSSVDTTVTTDADGNYAFVDLRSGTYTVTVDQASARAVNPAYAVTYDPEHGLTAPTGSFSVALGLNSTIAARDVGFATQSLSGVVYDDLDNDGAQDAGEDGNVGVDVTLTGTDDLGAPVTRTVPTAADGAYTFTDLRPGTYRLDKQQLPSTLPGKNSAGTAGGDAGAVGTNEITGITLDPAENAMGYLFGELPPEVISGIVFLDGNDDGVQDAGELGISNVTLALAGTDDLGGPVSLITQTLADGTFTFAGLRNGTYTLTETQPSPFLQGTTATNGSVGVVDDDVISSIVVDGNNATTGYAFAELPPASISGLVFDDLDADGTRDAGEPGIEGVLVELSGTDSDGNAITPVTITTDGGGAYIFSGLRRGTYVVTETNPAGYLDGRETAGSAGGTVDNTVPGSNAISTIPLAVGADAIGYHFADVRAASIAGVVYVDSDNDGVQDAGELGIGGVAITVEGTDDFDQLVDRTASTDSDGTYEVTDLRPGTYSVTETQPPAYIDGLDAAGSAGGAVGNDTVTDIVLGSGAAATAYLFGERVPASIGGAVFSDLDADGERDGGEPGIAGVTVDLLDGAGAVIDSTQTGSDGSWQFAELTPGIYGVREIQPASGYANGATVAGSAGGTVGTDEVTGIVLDEDATGYLFAEIELVGVQGHVWNDADDDGVVDAGEAAIAGVTITLTGGEASAVTTTGADGSFVFAGLVPGEYTLTETQPSNWVDGRTVIGDAGGTASADNTISGITLAPGVLAAGYGFGERTAELQLFVRTQSQDVAEPNGPNVKVGDPVRWTYEVRNNGDAPLTGLVLQDDKAGAVSCPSTDIAPHSSITCEKTGTAVAGQYTNNVKAQATVVPSAAELAVAAVVELEATDTSYYFGMVVSADIKATVNGQDATTGPGPLLSSGSTANVVITVTNTGNVSLEVDSIDSGTLGALDCDPDGPVAPGDSMECTTTWDPASGNYDFPVSIVLAAPSGVSVSGESAATALAAETEVFFMVDEADVVPPASPPVSPRVSPPESRPTSGRPLPVTGLRYHPVVLGASVALLIMGGFLVVLAADRRRGSEK